MIAHNGDHKRIAPIILDIHMSIVSEQWTNYSCPMIIDFQTSCLSLYSNYPIIVCLYMHCHWRSSYQEREGWGPISLLNSATCFGLSEARIWISNVICCGLYLFPVSSVKMRGHCFALFDIG